MVYQPPSTPPRPAGPQPAIANLDTPTVCRMDKNLLQQHLREAVQLLRERDKDVRMAAEIGQSLLEANERLKQDNDVLADELSRLKKSIQTKKHSQIQPSILEERVQAPTTDERNTAQHIFHLETSNAEFQKQIETLQRQLNDTRTIDSRRVASLEAEVQRYRETVDHVTTQYENLLQEYQELSRTRHELIQTSKQQASKSSDEMVQYSRKIDELEESNSMLAHENNKLTETVGEFEERLQLSDQHLSEMRDQLEPLQEMANEFEMLRSDNAECRAALDESRQHIQYLTDQLEIQMLKGPDAAPSVKDNKSLFNEIEDRRVELDTKYRSLTQKHSGLVKAHVASVHQQERMRHHISRLSQLVQHKSGDDAVERLDQTISQLTNENRQLRMKLTTLERRSSFGICSSTDAIVTAVSTDDVAEFLQLRVDQLTNTLTEVQKELQTVNLLRLSDMEKQRVTERRLMQLEKELEGARAQNVQLRFELSEWKARADLANVLSEDVCEERVKIPTGADMNKTLQPECDEYQPSHFVSTPTESDCFASPPETVTTQSLRNLPTSPIGSQLPRTEQHSYTGSTLIDLKEEHVSMNTSSQKNGWRVDEMENPEQPTVVEVRVNNDAAQTGQCHQQ